MTPAEVILKGDFGILKVRGRLLFSPLPKTQRFRLPRHKHEWTPRVQRAVSPAGTAWDRWRTLHPVSTAACPPLCLKCLSPHGGISIPGRGAGCGTGRRPASSALVPLTRGAQGRPRSRLPRSLSPSPEPGTTMAGFIRHFTCARPCSELFACVILRTPSTALRGISI